MTPFIFTISDRVAAQLNRYVSDGRFEDRCEAIRAALALLVFVNEEESRGRVIASLFGEVWN